MSYHNRHYRTIEVFEQQHYRPRIPKAVQIESVMANEQQGYRQAERLWMHLRG